MTTASLRLPTERAPRAPESALGAPLAGAGPGRGTRATTEGTCGARREDTAPLGHPGRTGGGRLGARVEWALRVLLVLFSVVFWGWLLLKPFGPNARVWFSTSRCLTAGVAGGLADPAAGARLRGPRPGELAAHGRRHAVLGVRAGRLDVLRARPGAKRRPSRRRRTWLPGHDPPDVRGARHAAGRAPHRGEAAQHRSGCRHRHGQHRNRQLVRGARRCTPRPTRRGWRKRLAWPTRPETSSTSSPSSALPPALDRPTQPDRRALVLGFGLFIMADLGFTYLTLHDAYESGPPYRHWLAAGGSSS